MATKRDPKVKALADVLRAKATVDKVSATLDTARETYYRAVSAALTAGMSSSEVSRQVGTDPSRIRQIDLRTKAKATLR